MERVRWRHDESCPTPCPLPKSVHPMGDQEETILGSVGGGRTGPRGRTSAGRIMRVIALLLLVEPIAPPGALPSRAAVPGNSPSRGAIVADHSAILPGNVRVSERLFGLPGLANVGQVAPGIIRGAQPMADGYATLKAMGINTVVNLRKHHGERKAVETAGMRYVAIPMSYWWVVEPALVRKALSVLADPANQPVFIHCSTGLDRTGVVVAVYRMEVDGWSREEALQEMEAFGFHDIWFELKKTVREWRRRTTAPVGEPPDARRFLRVAAAATRGTDGRNVQVP